MFVDNFADAEGTINYFKDYMESETNLKCWHNYGFDRHILYNHGINTKGFGGDTMHMARLADPSRLAFEYSLSHLSKIYDVKITETKRKLIEHLTEEYKNDEAHLQSLKHYQTLFQSKNYKTDLVTLFGTQRKLKNGGTAKVTTFPKLEEIHCDPSKINMWVEYSSFDAEITYFLRETLSSELCMLKTHSNDIPTLYHLYLKYWLPFGELLTEIERVGIKLNLPYLKEIQVKAQMDCSIHEKTFLEWVHNIQEDAKEFNPNSTQQMAHLLFAPYHQLVPGSTSESPEQKETEGDQSESKKEKPGYVDEVKYFIVENTAVFMYLGSSRAQ